MNVAIPEIETLRGELEKLTQELSEIKTRISPQKKWWNLKEACEVKGLCYKTASNRPRLQPCAGVEDGRIGGRKVWKIDTIEKWFEQTDHDLLGSDG